MQSPGLHLRDSVHRCGETGRNRVLNMHPGDRRWPVALKSGQHLYLTRLQGTRCGHLAWDHCLLTYLPSLGVTEHLPQPKPRNPLATEVRCQAGRNFHGDPVRGVLQEPKLTLADQKEVGWFPPWRHRTATQGPQPGRGGPGGPGQRDRRGEGTAHGRGLPGPGVGGSLEGQ
jgi:hypothetical protein